MSTKALMTTTAAVFFVIGVALIFLPDEIGNAIGLNSALSLVALQLLGGAYFGFAMINWTAKGTLLGGIYGRPIAIGNFAHFLVGAPALLKSAGEYEGYLLYIAGAVYAAFALTFGLVLFTHPKTKG